MITFPSSTNPADGDLLRVGGYTYEFDNNLSYTAGNMVIPLGGTFADTFSNIKTELQQNPNINLSQSGANALILSAKSSGTSGNTLTLSGSSSAFSLTPASGTLSGGVSFGTGTQLFSFDKSLADGQLYDLTFYTASATGATSDVLALLIEVSSATGTATYKITQLNTTWGYNDFIFPGYNPTGTGSQRIEFRVKNGNFVFFDAISLTALGTRQSDQNLSTFRIDTLPGFFVKNTMNFVVDGYNQKLKGVDTGGLTISTIKSSFSLTDPRSLVIHDRADFFGNSAIDRLSFGYFSYTNLAPSKIEYSVSNGTSILKLVGNVGK